MVDLNDPTEPWAAGPAVTAQADREVTPIELVRLTGAALHKAAKKLGIEDRTYEYDYARLATDILNAARGGGLEPWLYRCVFWIESALHSDQEQN